MSRKDFNKGMEAGAKPFEEKFKMQEEAIERVEKNLNERLDNFDTINDFIIDDLASKTEDLTSIKKKELYDLNTLVSIDDLDDWQKEFLMAMIYTVANRLEYTTELQKKFIRSVKNYLGIVSLQTEVDLSCIENIERIGSQKVILQVLMEFLFLEKGNHSYLEKYEDIISYFNVNKRGIEDIQEKINNIYVATGLEGIAEKYGYIPEEDQISSNDLDGAEEKFEEMTEITISKILHIGKGETKKFENNVVHINSYINNQGDLIFDNCVIHYNEPGFTNEIALSEGSSLEIKNSEVICENININFFIRGKGDNRVIFENCYFFDCSYFIKLDYSSSKQKSEIMIKSCTVLNPFVKFFDGYFKKGLLDNCYINFRGLSEKDKKYMKELSKEYAEASLSALSTRTASIIPKLIEANKDIKKPLNEEAGEALYHQVTFLSREDADFSVRNCKMEGVEVFSSQKNNFKIFEISGGTYEVCSFKDVDNCIVNPGEVINCVFEDCESVIKSGSDTKILNCQFVKCKNRIISVSSNGNALIEFCEFYNIEYEKSNKENSDACLYFERLYREASVVRKCIFNGVNIENGFLIMGEVRERKITPAVRIEECNFQNCVTKRESGKIIKEYQLYYYGFFGNKKTELIATEVINCTGLDKVNKENGHTEYDITKLKAHTGINVGATIASTLLLGGVPGLAVGLIAGRVLNKNIDIHLE